MSSANTAAAFTQYTQTFTAAGSSATLQFYHLGTGNRTRWVFVSDVQISGDAQQTIGEQLWNVTGNTLEVMRLEAGNNISFDSSFGVINISSTANNLNPLTGYSATATNNDVYTAAKLNSSVNTQKLIQVNSSHFCTIENGDIELFSHGSSSTISTEAGLISDLVMKSRDSTNNVAGIARLRSECWNGSSFILFSHCLLYTSPSPRD